MLENSEAQKYLDAFTKSIVKESRANLSKLKKNSSRSLWNSIKGKSKVMPNSMMIEFSMEEYGYYQDKGVNGVGPATRDKNGKLKTLVTDGEYKFTSKGGIRGLKGMPPPAKFDKWIVRKGIAPRDKNGKFISRKSLSFLIARSVFRNGIKPSLFFTKAYQSAYKRLPNELVKKYGLDASELLKLMIKQPTKK